LTSQEVDLIASVHAASLDEFSRELHDRLPELTQRHWSRGPKAEAA